MSHSFQRSAESDRTLVRPMPGGRHGLSKSSSAPAGTAVPSESTATLVAPGGTNSILAAAHELLAIAPRLRQSATHPDPHRLKDDLTLAIRSFEQRAASAGVPQQKIIAARYIICTFLDECAASTPWGSGGIWARDTLLVRMHNETWGGEKIFQLLTKLAQDPSANADLLELIYVCLTLGFEGRYKVVENGRSQLDMIRERLYHLLRQHKGSTEAGLSAHWKPAQIAAKKWISLTPLWVVATMFVFAAIALFATYQIKLNQKSDSVFSLIQSIHPSTAQTDPVQPSSLPPAEPQLRGFLQKEIEAGLVSVSETAKKSVINVHGDGLFKPGSSTVNDAYLPLIDRIANEIKHHPGKVAVSGHTDSTPIRSVRYPSNFHLSQERAQTVADRISKIVGAQRVNAEGRADAEPVAPNDTPAGRAKNRRVEIVLFRP